MLNGVKHLITDWLIGMTKLYLPVIGMLPLYVIANIKYYTSKKVKYKRKAHCKE
jgi:hypothetical protein